MINIRLLIEEKQSINSQDLVPGDIMLVHNSTTMPCDAVLLDGSVSVNESMLTGESIPITKVQIPYYKAPSDHTGLGQSFDAREHNQSILFSGAIVIQTRHDESTDIKAVTIRTGSYSLFHDLCFYQTMSCFLVAFNTTKGELIRSVLFPKPVDFNFSRDTYKYVGGMATIAGCGMILSLVLRVSRIIIKCDL